MIREYKYNKKQKSAVGLVCADRPDYFTQVLQSVVPNLGNRHLYIFADIPPNGDETAQNQQKAMVENNLSKGKFTFIRHTEHMGCGHNMIFARRYLFDLERYEYAHILEDDLVLSEGYLDLCENIMDWCQIRYPNVGIVQGWSEKKYEEGQDPYQIYSTYDHWWAYYQSRKSWDMIKPVLYAFEHNFLDKIVEYRQRDHRGIMQWKMGLLQQMMPNKEKYAANFFPDNPEVALEKMQAFVTGQDGMNLQTLFLTNQVRVAPVIGRGKYIGERGEHYTPDIFARHGFGKIPLYFNEDDAARKEFSV